MAYICLLKVTPCTTILFHLGDLPASVGTEGILSIPLSHLTSTEREGV